MAQKYDMSPTSAMFGEYEHFNLLFAKGNTITTTGIYSFTSSTSGETYSSANGGEMDVLGQLKAALNNYMALATDLNAKAEVSDLTTLQDALSSHTAENAVLMPQDGSTANALILNIVLTDKKKGTFRASTNNTGNMTINGKAFKKDAVTEISADGVKAGKVYDFYYDQTADCVFILAKASGTAQPSDVLAGKTFSNDDGEHTGTKDLSWAVPANVKKGVEFDGQVGLHNQIEVLTPGGITYAEHGLISFASSTMTKIVSIPVNVGGVVRIRFQLTASTNTYAQAQIYVNGVSVGVLREEYNSYSTLSENIAVNAGDVVQIYARRSGGVGGCDIRNILLQLEQPLLVGVWTA